MSIVIHYAPKTRAARVLWALEELGVPYEKVRVDMEKKEHKTPAYKAINPNGTVPAMVVDGTPMFESLAMVLYLADRFGVEKGLWPSPTDPARVQALSWVVWAVDTLGQKAFQLAHATSSYVPKEWHNDAQAANGREGLSDCLAIVEAQLNGREYLLGNSFSLADIPVAGSLGFLTMLGFDIKKWEKAAEYTKRCTSRPAFGRAMSA